jgi:hypothetical protein
MRTFIFIVGAEYELTSGSIEFRGAEPLARSVRSGDAHGHDQVVHERSLRAKHRAVLDDQGS